MQLVRIPGHLEAQLDPVTVPSPGGPADFSASWKENLNHQVFFPLVLLFGASGGLTLAS